jgi:hypothetical protein
LLCRVLSPSTRQSLMAWVASAITWRRFCRGLALPSVALGKEDLCRVSLFAECQALCGT